MKNEDSLRELSEATGGLPIVSRNDLGTAFDRIVADNSAYYVLGYRRRTTSATASFIESPCTSIAQASPRVRAAGIWRRTSGRHRRPRPMPADPRARCATRWQVRCL